MEVHHKIRPPHGWREFLFEIGIIVIGVLIALGAEQTVEALHRLHQVDEAQIAMTEELRGDNGPQAFARAAVWPCLSKRLTVMRDALRANADRKIFNDLATAYQPPIRTWDDQAWLATTSSSVGTYMGADKMTAWSRPYSLIKTMQSQATGEEADFVELHSGSDTPGKMSEAQHDERVFVVSRLLQANYYMSVLSLGLLEDMRKIGVELSAEQRRQLLAEARVRYGSCVTEPDSSLWRKVSQFASDKAVKPPF